MLGRRRDLDDVLGSRNTTSSSFTAWREHIMEAEGGLSTGSLSVELRASDFRVPVRPQEDGRVDLEGSGQLLGSFGSESHATAFDARNGRLRDAACLGKLGLGQFLKLPSDTYRVPR